MAFHVELDIPPRSAREKLSDLSLGHVESWSKVSTCEVRTGRDAKAAVVRRSPPPLCFDFSRLAQTLRSGLATVYCRVRGLLGIGSAFGRLAIAPFDRIMAGTLSR